jgi:hypothetical protein
LADKASWKKELAGWPFDFAQDSATRMADKLRWATRGRMGKSKIKNEKAKIQSKMQKFGV